MPNPPEKPSHLSKAVGETMNSVQKPETGPSAKPAPEAAPSQSEPSKTPDSGPQTPDDPGADTAPPARQPGRPRKTRINRFSTDTDLDLDERFIEFREITGASEGEALLSIMTLNKYAARYVADTGCVSNLSDEKLAKRCFWQKEPSLFVDSLIESGFLNFDRIIVDWFDLQPHAKEYLRKVKYSQKREEQEKQKDTEYARIPPNSDGKNCKGKAREEKRREEQALHACDHEIALAFAKICRISTKSKEYDTICKWINKLHQIANSDVVSRITTEIQEGFQEGRIDNPTGVLITEVRKLTDSQKQTPEDHVANQQPDPTCPKCKHLLINSACTNCDYVTEKWKKQYQKDHPKSEKNPEKS